MIKAKMHLEAIIPNTWGGSQAVFRACYDPTLPEDQKFMKATPTADARFTIDNPEAVKQLVVGGYYYFDIHPADKRTADLLDRERKLQNVRKHMDDGGEVALLSKPIDQPAVTMQSPVALEIDKEGSVAGLVDLA